MKILIVGAGRAGLEVAIQLSRIGHAVTIVDTDAAVARRAAEQYGLVAIAGDATTAFIGEHFPPSDPRWKGATSDIFLAHAAGLIRSAGGIIDHVDCTVICEEPKLSPHRSAMRANVARILALPEGAVSIKATTTERLGFTGRREGIAAQAVASIRMELKP